MATGYSVSIGISDNLTKPLEAINKRLMAIQEPFNRLQKSMSKFADLTGLTGVVNGMKRLGEHVLGALGYVLRLIPAMGALTGAASVAGVFKLVTSWGDLGNRLVNTSTILGTSVGRLQELEGAAKLAGASTEAMDASIAGLGAAMQSALSGNNANAVNLFRDYGINIKEAGFQAKNGAEKMQAAMGILKSGHDKGDSADVTKQKAATLGISEDLIPLALSGKLQEHIDQYNKLGNPLSDKQAKEAKTFASALEGVSTAMGGIVNAITTALGPALTPLLNQLSQWLASNDKLVNETVTKWVEDFSKWVNSIKWADVRQGISDFGKGTAALAESLGGVLSVTKLLFELWAGAQAVKVAAMMLSMATSMKVLAGGGVPAIAGAGAGAGAAGAGAAGAAGAGGLAGLAKGLPLAGLWLGLALEVKEWLPPMLHEGLSWLFGVNPGPRPAAEGGAGGKGLGSATSSGTGGGHANENDRGYGKAASGKELRAREDAEYKRAIDNGATPMEAAALAGNASQESGINPGARGDKNKAGEYTAFGKFQWHQDRVDKIKAGAGIDVKTAGDDDQTKAALWELRNNEKAAGEAIRAAKTAREAGSEGSRKFERPGLTEDVKAAEAAHRGQTAQDVYDRNHDKPAAPPASIHTPLGPQRNPEMGGSIDLNVTHTTPPPGTSLGVKTSGSVNQPRISRPMSADA